MRIPTLRKALRAAREAGATVEDVRRTGEIRVRFGRGAHRRTTVNKRRKDASRELLRLLRQEGVKP